MMSKLTLYAIILGVMLIDSVREASAQRSLMQQQLTAKQKQAAEATVLRGKAVFIEPLQNAQITIFALDRRGFESEPLQVASLGGLYNGVFAVQLRPSVKRALEQGRDLRLLVEGRTLIPHAAGPESHRVRLRADLSEFDPNLHVVRVDLYSTLLSAYRRTHRELTLAEARSKVHAGLGAPASTASICATTFSAAYLISAPWATSPRRKSASRAWRRSCDVSPAK